VVATGADARAKATILGWLEEAEVSATDARAATIVIVSRAAAGDPAWTAAADAAADGRVIPIQVGDVRDEEISSVVAGLNRLRYRPDDEAQTRTDLLFALNADPRLHAKHRELAAEADAWAASGRRREELIADVRRAKEANEHVRLAATDALSAPTPLIREFVAASSAHARRRRVRGRFSRGWRLALAAFAAIAIAGAVITVRSTTRHTKLAVVNDASGHIMGISRPDRVAMLSAAMLVNGSTVLPAVRQSLWSVLAVPWTEGVIGQRYDAQILDSAIVDGGRAVLTLDTAGRLARWQRRTTDLSAVRQLSAAPGAYAMSATPDGRTIAAALGRRLSVIRDGHVTTAVLPASPTGVAVSRDGRVIAVSTAAGLSVIRRSGAPRSQDGDDVLALGPTAHGVSALGRSGNVLRLFDVATNRTLALTRRRRYRYETAAIGPDGNAVAITDASRQILYAPSKLGLEPTGQAVPDVVRALAVLAGGRVAYASDAFGVQLLDAVRRINLGPICAALATATTIRTTPTGDLVACTDAVVALQPTADLTAVDRETPGLSRSVSGRAGPVTVDGRRDGAIDVVVRGGSASRYRYRLAEAPVTAVALGYRGRAVVAGAADGTVDELDLAARDTGPVVVRWMTPDRAAVSAVGWSGGSLIAETVTGDRWHVPACDLCAGDRELIDAVKRRLWPCYRPEAFDSLDGATRRLLALHTCPATKAG
jgi:hypothetical protein